MPGVAQASAGSRGKRQRLDPKLIPINKGKTVAFRGPADRGDGSSRLGSTERGKLTAIGAADEK
jgi:hypothetical protein